MTQGFGIEQYGLGPYGGQTYPGISLISAVAISTHEAILTLSIEPLHEINSQPGDALNPATWVIQRLDNNEFLHVALVNPYSDTEFGIVATEAFGDYRVKHIISTSTLIGANREPAVPPLSTFFYGTLDQSLVSRERRLANRRASLRDLANPQTPKAFPSDILGGTLLIDSSGDYETEIGTALLKKLIIRRLMTAPRDFFHLPDYGVGFRNKEPLPSGDLVLLKAEIENQVRREPEVEDVAAALLLDANGILYVRLAVKVRPTGQQLDIGLKMPQTAVAF